MRLTAQEEYGLRCLLQVARRAPEASDPPVPIRDVAEAEGLSSDYAAKLLRVLRKGGLLTAERGASGGFRLARPAAETPMSEVMRVLDGPLFAGSDFCQQHAGKNGSCVHGRSCTLTALWTAIDGALAGVLDRLVLADMLDSASVATQLTQESA